MAEWQREAEDAARAGLALYHDRASMQLYKRLGDRQPKASAAHLIAERCLGTVKACEQLALLLGRYPNAGIFDLNLDILAVALERPDRYESA